MTRQLCFLSPEYNSHRQKMRTAARNSVVMPLLWFSSRKPGEMWSPFSISQMQTPLHGAVAAAHILRCAASGSSMFSSFNPVMPN